MHKLYDLKEMLCEELKEYGSKDKLDVGGLEIVDKLAHAIKNIDRIIETYEMDEEYSMDGGESGQSRRGSSYRGSSRRGSSYEGGSSRRSYYDGGSYGRGSSYARGRGRNARRDSMGRYSSAESEEMVEELRELMQEAPEQTKQEFQRLISKLEQM